MAGVADWGTTSTKKYLICELSSGELGSNFAAVLPASPNRLPFVLTATRSPFSNAVPDAVMLRVVLLAGTLFGSTDIENDPSRFAFADAITVFD